MKIAILRVSNDILLGKQKDEISQYLLRNILEIGEVVNKVITTENHPDQIFNALNDLNCDLVIVIGEALSSKNFNIKKSICNFINSAIIKSDQATNFVNAYFQKSNIPISFEAENEYYMPEYAKLISTTSSFLQAYTVTNNNTNYLFIPGELEVATEVFNNYLKNYIIGSNNTIYKTTTIKTFGIGEKDIYLVLSDLIKNKYKILFFTYPNNLEVSIVIRYNQNLDESIVNDFVVKVYERLGKYIYADEETSLIKRTYELLELSKKKVAIAETITGGNISASLLKQCSDSKNLVIENMVCLSENSLIKRLNVSPNVLRSYGTVSVEIAYEMAAGLLESSEADIVVVTNGLTNFNNDKKGKLCFIAVGNSDGIHVYKNTVYGNREQVVESLTQTAFFYLIKNIKQNDLFFDKTTI